ncbi:MAG: matrixin family metalloprotease [Myxococcota bacterium]|nr:matrixin family metalloprotease [Myxococcota bacterium]
MFLALAMGLTSPADAYEVMTKESGALMRWPAWPLEYAVATDNPLGLDENGTAVATQRAAQAWEGMGTSVKTSFVGTTDNTVTGHDGLNTVYLTEDWPWEPTLLAMTSSFSDSEGNFVGFDIAVNAKDHEWSLAGDSDRIDLQNTLAHEWGHVLGMGHSDADAWATMHASAAPGETHKRDLSQDDVDGLYFLYNEDGEAPRVVGCQSAPGAQSLAWLGAIATALTLGLRRRRS